MQVEKNYQPLWHKLSDDEVRMHESYQNLFITELQDNLNKEKLLMRYILATLTILSIFIVGSAFADSKNVTTSTTTTAESHTIAYRTVAHKDLMTIKDRSALQTQIERNFKKLDLNKNRLIEMDEFVSHSTQNGNNMDTSEALFHQLDINSNGAISSQEIMDSKMREKAVQVLADMAATPPAAGTVVYQERTVTYDQE